MGKSTSGRIQASRLERLFKKHGAWVYNGGNIRRVRDCRDELGLSEHASRHLVRTVKQRLSGAKAPEDKPPEMTSDTLMEKEVYYTASECMEAAELCEHFGLDPDEWEFDKVLVNKWEGFYKSANGTAIKVPQYQFKVTLQRKLSTRWRRPTIDIELKRTERQEPANRDELAVFVPDMQFGWRWSEDYRSLYPLHDPVALDVTLQVLDDCDPDWVFILGDAADLAPWSTKYTSHPLLKRTTQPTIDGLFWYLGQIRQRCPHARIIFVPGNHDIRPETAILERLPELLGLRAPRDDMPLMALSRIFGLDLLDIEVAAGGRYDKGFWLWPESDSPILVHHGEGRPKDAVKEVKDASYSMVHGHVHKVQAASKTIHGPDGKRTFITAMTPGCLCRLGGHVPGFKKSGREDWQHGIGFASLHDGSPILWSVPFNGNTVSMGTGTYVGRDLTPQMAEATGWEQMKLD